MKLSFSSVSSNVAFARTTVAVFASQLEFTLEELEDIKVAVSEAVSNAVIHGYKNQEGTVYVDASFEGNTLEVLVVDQGVGIFDVNEAKEAGFTTIPEERMGLGFVFIHEYMDRVEIQSQIGEGTRLWMRKSAR